MGERDREVLFSYAPPPSFTSSLGWLFCLLPLMGVIGGAVDLLTGTADARDSVLLMGASVAASALVLGLSRLVDRAQRRVLLEVGADGWLRLRRAWGPDRRIRLAGAREVRVRAYGGRPRPGGLFGGPSRLHAPGALSPRVIEVRVRDREGRSRTVTLSGAMSRADMAELRAALGRFAPVR